VLAAHTVLRQRQAGHREHGQPVVAVVVVRIRLLLGDEQRHPLTHFAVRPRRSPAAVVRGRWVGVTAAEAESESWDQSAIRPTQAARSALLAISALFQLEHRVRP
jgi:hypothetical protein